MKTAIETVVSGKDLTEEEAKRVMNIMLSGDATQAQIGSLLTALRMKGTDWFCFCTQRKSRYDFTKVRKLCRFCRNRRGSDIYI